MKRFILLSGMAVVVLLIHGCAKDPVDGTSVVIGNEKVRITSSGSDGTRAALDDDGVTVRWTKDDALGIFMKCPASSLQSSKYTIIEGSFGDDDPNADFEGSLEWGEEPGDYTFFGYNPMRRDLQTDPENVLVTLSSVRTKEGATTKHYTNGYFAVAEPGVIPSDGTRSGRPAVSLKFHHLFPLVELRFAALDCRDLTIKRVMLSSSKDLSVVDGALDVTKLPGEAGFATLRGGQRYKTIRLDIDGCPSVPFTDDPDLYTGDQKETPESVFAARMNILPGEHDLDILVYTDKGTFKVTKDKREFVRGRRYVSTIVLDPASPNVGIWDEDTEPVPPDDYYEGCGSVTIEHAGHFAWCEKVLKYQTAPYGFENMTINLMTDIDMAETPWFSAALLKNVVFNGNGHRIYNFKLDAANAQVGFFSQAENSFINELHIQGTVTSSKDWAAVGGIVGSIEGGEMKGCSFTGEIRSTHASPAGCYGGLCGQATNVSFVGCANYASVSFPSSGYWNRAGGIVGLAQNDTSVTASYNQGDIAGGRASAGGIAGQVKARITACYNTGTVKGGSSEGNEGSTGQIYGNADGGNLEVDRCYALSGSQCEVFSEENWPVDSDEWGIGSGDGSGPGNYWKSLGGWNGGYSYYPLLWWE